jgi:hypothetical protein
LNEDEDGNDDKDGMETRIRMRIRMGMRLGIGQIDAHQSVTGASVLFFATTSQFRVLRV